MVHVYIPNPDKHEACGINSTKIFTVLAACKNQVSFRSGLC